MAEVLYFDKQVTVYKDLIVINRYFFPLATSKTIMISDIEMVSLIDAEGVNHRWGTCQKYLNNWFPLDGNRQEKKKFIEIRIKGKRMRPSITPDNPDAVFQILWANFTKEGKDYIEEVAKQTEKETEMCQQELMERKQAEEEAKSKYEA